MDNEGEEEDEDEDEDEEDDEEEDDDDDDEEAFYKGWKERRAAAAAEAAAAAAPTDASTKTTLSAARRAEILALGFPDDGYDYLQHLKTLDEGDARDTKEPGGGSGGGSRAQSVFIASSRPRVREVQHETRAYDGGQVHTTIRSAIVGSHAEDTGRKKEVEDADDGRGGNDDDGDDGDIVEFAKGVHQLRSVPKNRELAAVVEELDRMSGIAGDAKDVGGGIFEFGDLNDDFMLFASQPADDDEENDVRTSRRTRMARGAAAADDEASAMDAVMTSGAAFMQEKDVQVRLLDECFDALALREYNDDDDIDDFDSEDDYDDDDDDDDASHDGDDNTRRQRSRRMGADISEFDHVLDEYLEKTRGKKYLTENDDAEAVAASAVVYDESRHMLGTTSTPAPALTTGNRGIDGVCGDVDDLYRASTKKPYKEGGSCNVRFNVAEEEATLQEDDDIQEEESEDADTDDRSQYYDGKFSYIDREREWVEISSARARNNDEDIESCMSFRTTLSTPSIIPMVRTLGVPHKSRGSRDQSGLTAAGEDSIERKIILSNKTGLPIGYYPGGRNSSDGIASEPAGSGDVSPAPIEKASTHRPRDETREDRRARKQAVKAERRMNRSRKKELKTEFGKAERRVASLKDNPPTIPL